MATLKLALVVLMYMAVVGAPMAPLTCVGFLLNVFGPINSPCWKFHVVLAKKTNDGQTLCDYMTDLVQCLGYLEWGGTVPPACCAGLRFILSLVRTTRDRQICCNCIKAIGGRFPGINRKNLEAIPSQSQCGLNIPYKINYSTSCARMK